MGIQLKNENKLEEMVEIMANYHQYVPKLRTEKAETIDSTGEAVVLTIHQFHHLLFGGDQLTAARARGAQKIRSNSETALGRLAGLVPNVEDWHAKVCLIEVCIY